MRIDCPACAAIYDVPESIMTGGPRALRCAGCGETWLPDFAEAFRAAPAPPAAAPEPRQPPQPREVVEEDEPEQYQPRLYNATPPAPSNQSPPEPEPAPEQDRPRLSDAPPPAPSFQRPPLPESAPEPHVQPAPEPPPAPAFTAAPQPGPAPAPKPEPPRAAGGRDDLMAMLAAAADTSRGLPAGVRATSRDADRADVPRFTRTQNAPPARVYVPTEDAPKPDEIPAAIAASITAEAAVPRPSLALLVAWIATLGSVGVVLLTFMFFPQTVVGSWPAATRLYQVVGLLG